MNEIELRITVNGSSHELRVPPLRRLLDVLREDLHLCGTKEGCGEGECGACAVLCDGELVNSCLVAACQVRSADIVTVEARCPGIEAAFLAEGGTQCGICTPGMVMATRAYLERCRARREPVTEVSARAALAGNLCRCTGYGMIVASVLAAAGERP